ncbi:MAG: L-2-hydroxyglutarate oxidase [Vicinamibacterales bacterium]
MKRYDLVIVGGGIVGMATALQIVRLTRASVLVLEAESALGAHQTGHNSGVIHSGVYYKPGSLKATSCASGREEMYAFCAEHAVMHERCGKIVVATSEAELPKLAELEERSRANGLPGVKRLTASELKEHEPHVAGLAGLLVPTTGIVDYKDVVTKYGELVRAAGGEVALDCRLVGVARRGSDIVLETTRGEFETAYVVTCCGLQCDRIARMCGSDPGVQVIPFRGEYYELVPEKHHLVKNLIYPVPDPRFPFLGVHFTRMVKGGVEAGPNAVLAFKREGYTFSSFDGRDVADMLGFPGFWKMAGKYWRAGFDEFHRSLSKAAFVKALQKLMPEIEERDLRPGGAGVRAQAVDSDGRLIDDFHIKQDDRFIHVLNAPSPAATASLSIGRSIAEMAKKNFSLS